VEKHLAKLITVQRARNEIVRLQHYVDLVESYPSDSLEKWIIKEYGYTNSLIKVVEHANAQGFTLDGKPIERQYVLSVINGKATDELHKMLKAGYRRKANVNKPKQISSLFY
jgi:hypothetical protein